MGCLDAEVLCEGQGTRERRVLVVPGVLAHWLAQEGARVVLAGWTLRDRCGVSQIGEVRMLVLMRTLRRASTTTATMRTRAARAVVLLLPLRALLLLLLSLRTLLLLAEGRVGTLALDGADLVSVRTLSATLATMALLPLEDDGLTHVRESDRLDRGLAGSRLETRKVDLDHRVHSCRELGHEHHPLDVLGDGELVRLETLEVRLELVESGDGVGVGRDGQTHSGAEVLVDDRHAGLAVGVLQVSPHVRRRRLCLDGGDDGRRDAKADVALGPKVIGLERLESVGLGGGRRARHDDMPLALRHEEGLHGLRPLKVVGAGESGGDSVVEGARHGDRM